MALPTDAYESGTVTGAFGANGLLQALLDFVSGTRVTGESLSGSGTSWSGTAANNPIAPGTFNVTYTIGGTEYDVTDNGVGGIEEETDNTITAGSINYETGAYSFTFTATATLLEVTYMYGQPGQDWEVLRNQNTTDNTATPGEPFGSNCKEVILKNTGLSGLEQVLIGIREWEYTTENAAGWDLNGYTWYSDEMIWWASASEHNRNSYDSDWEHFDELPMLPLVDDTLYYWFFSNRQRIIVIVKVQSYYESCYMGFGHRYGPPERYPTPLCIKGSSYGIYKYTNTAAMRCGLATNYWDNDGFNILIVDPGGSWRGVSGDEYELGPRCIPMTGFSTALGLIVAHPTTGRVMAFPVTLATNIGDAVWMDLDGVLGLAGTGVQSEDIIKDKDNNKKYRAFQDIWRTGSTNYFCVCQDPTWSTTTSTTSTTVTTTTSTTVTTTTTSTTSTTTTTV